MPEGKMREVHFHPPGRSSTLPGHTVFDGPALDAVRVQLLMRQEDPQALQGDARLHGEQQQAAVIFKHVFCKNRPRLTQWFPLGAEGPTSSLISEVSAFPTPSGCLRRKKLNGSGFLFVFL